MVTYPGQPLTADTYKSVVNITTDKNEYVNDVVPGDIDGDGTIDLVLAVFGATYPMNGINVYHNASTKNNIVFDQKKNYQVNSITTLAVGDIDGDGKLDVAVTDNGLDADKSLIIIYRNISTPGNIEFAKPDSLMTSIGPESLVIADIDKDGKQDIATVGSAVNIFKNIGSPGKVRFLTRINYPVNGQRIIANDLNNDGSSELIVSSVGDGITVFENKSVPGNIHLTSFTLSVAQPYTLASEDMDGDGRYDIITTEMDNPNLHVLRNTGTGVSISFASAHTVNINQSATALSAGDLDGDGKADIQVSVDQTNLSVLRNTSNIGNISMAPALAYSTPKDYTSDYLTVCDIDGDGQADPLIPKIFLYVLLKEPGHSTVLPPVITDFSPRSATEGTTVTITGDEFKDVSAVYFGNTPASSFTVVSPTKISAVLGKGSSGLIKVTTAGGTASLGNFTYEGWEVIVHDVCATRNADLMTLNTGSSYQWQMSTDGNFVDVVDNEYLSGTKTSTMRIRKIPASWDGYEFRCFANGVQSSHVYRISIHKIVDPQLSVTASATAICQGAPVTFTATITGAIQPVFTWQVNNINKGGNSPVFQYSELKNNDRVHVIVDATGSCSTIIKDTSEVIRMTVSEGLSAMVNITGKTNVINGESATISATVTNSGQQPAYQWQDSTHVHGWQDIENADQPVISYTTAVSGDKLRCVFNSVSDCGHLFSATSNVLTFVVSSNATLGPNPAENFLQLNGLEVEDNWQKVEITNSQGNIVLVQRIQNATSIKIYISGLKPGIYVVNIRNNAGESRHYKFVKL
jgi:hypothetical protein